MILGYGTITDLPIAIVELQRLQILQYVFCRSLMRQIKYCNGIFTC
jgi:hypothetical protein